MKPSYIGPPSITTECWMLYDVSGGRVAQVGISVVSYRNGMGWPYANINPDGPFPKEHYGLVHSMRFAGRGADDDDLW